jgi:hypothetical protein
MSRIVVHVDSLVLSGFDGVDVAAVSTALESALAARLGRDGALAAHDNAVFVRSGAIGIPWDASAAQIGRAVAGGIVRAGPRR